MVGTDSWVLEIANGVEEKAANFLLALVHRWLLHIFYLEVVILRGDLKRSYISISSGFPNWPLVERPEGLLLPEGILRHVLLVRIGLGRNA